MLWSLKPALRAFLGGGRGGGGGDHEQGGEGPLGQTKSWRATHSRTPNKALQHPTLLPAIYVTGAKSVLYSLRMLF